MATNAESRRLLDTLEDDRARLGRRAGAPAWLSATLALLTAAWVASPAFGRESAADTYVMVVVGVVAVIVLAERSVGIRHGRMRLGAYGVLAVAGIGALALYSASLGLTSLDLAGWVVVPAVAGAVVTHAAVTFVEGERSAEVTRGR